ncbi:hypothetical protein Golob_027438, partial [Gossypium lobatum]|nr:hypothetical protein [Gossypium lobatum]
LEVEVVPVLLKEIRIEARQQSRALSENVGCGNMSLGNIGCDTLNLIQFVRSRS